MNPHLDDALHPDVRIARLAAVQHGVVGRVQLLEAGLTRGAIEVRRRSGRLVLLHAGVYRTPGPLGPAALEMAAVLACGERAAASHRSAARLLGIRAPAPVSVEVIAEGRARIRRPGIRVYRPVRLLPGWRTTVAGVPVTTAARTLLDLAAILTTRELEQAIAHAERERLIGRIELRAFAFRHGATVAARVLLRLLDTYGELAFTRSEAEERFLLLLRRAGLPEPRTNVRIAGHEVDFYWPDARLAVEIDGARYHAHGNAFERDRQRDGDLAACGIRTIRVTWSMLTRESDRLLVRLVRALTGAVDPRDDA